jgi:hypothetical protein
MEIKEFQCVGEKQLRTLEERINYWISSQQCWLVISNISWKVVDEHPVLVVAYTTEERGPKQPPRTRAKVLYGPPQAIEQYMQLMGTTRLEHLHTSLLKCADYSEETCRLDFNVMVLMYRSRVVRLSLGADIQQANHRLNEWLQDAVSASQCPDSLVAIDNSTEITVDIGTSPFQPDRAFVFRGAVFDGRPEELASWSQPAPLVPDEMSGSFPIFPVRIISNVASSPFVGSVSFRVVILRFETAMLENAEM